ncbi:hypothetical protein EMIT0P218_30093 [Pseudomonas sp. IT-P218]
MALAAALPNHPQKERATLFTVIGVSALSTLAMIVYPMIAHGLSLMLACINSTGWIAPAVQGGVNEFSRWCLVISISALGMKTRLKELAAVGIKPILLMVGETVFLVVLVLLLLHWGS